MVFENQAQKGRFSFPISGGGGDNAWSNGLLSSEGHQTIPKTENIVDGHTFS